MGETEREERESERKRGGRGSKGCRQGRAKGEITEVSRGRRPAKTRGVPINMHTDRTLVVRVVVPFLVRPLTTVVLHKKAIYLRQWRRSTQHARQQWRRWRRQRPC